MVGTDFNILDPSRRAQLTAIQRTQSAVDLTQLRLATGNKVNSAIDNPQNFFTARALGHRSDDLLRLLDQIGQNIQVIKAADNALKVTEVLLNQAEALMNDVAIDLTTNQQNLSDIILADAPVAYWRLNETSGNVAENLGSGGAAINGTYNANIELEADPLYIGGGNESVAQFNGGNNHRVNIPDSNLINLGTHAERSIELVFNADSTSGRQVLYEEGGATNSLTLYVEDGRVYVMGRDAGAWGPVDISAEIEAGETYHLALVFDFPNRTFTGYLNGEEIGEEAVNAIFPAHSANIGIGGMWGDAWFHDGSAVGNDFEFHGRIGEVAIYNDVLTAEDIQERYDATFLQKSSDAEDALNELLAQLDLVAADATYRGTNLLDGDNLITVFNEFRTSSLITEGAFFSAAGLGISDDADFLTTGHIDGTFDQIRTALETVRAFGATLANDLSVMKIRESFIKGMVNTLDEGKQQLTIADQNEEGAKMLALQVRQQMQLSVLSFSNFSVADVLFA
ncbi:MAG: hypothetical protein H6867_07385 [Rhodospirillales bacterium]|nr:hypothetical protein [Rhodospirillales bacterium]MCB9995374.1 hypothetical protein [Rhodospirillales bacterium]